MAKSETPTKHYPLVQVVDAQDQPITAMPMFEAIEKGHHLRIVRIMVFDVSGKILLQKRAGKVMWPNLWDQAVGGHVDADETYEQAALREMAEEIGITEAEIKELAYYKSEVTYDNFLLHRFNKLYEATIDIKPRIINQDEVAALEWFTLTDIKNRIKNKPELFTGGLRKIITTYYS